MEASNSRWW
jgi:hypothetical protein